MNGADSSETSQTAIGILAFAVSGVMATGEYTWPSRDTPNYILTRTAPSYSYFSNQAMNVKKQHPLSDFTQEMATIYAFLSERQIRIDEEFEIAIF